jgi:hypothetical protein
MNWQTDIVTDWLIASAIVSYTAAAITTAM